MWQVVDTIIRCAQNILHRNHFEMNGWSIRLIFSNECYLWFPSISSKDYPEATFPDYELINCIIALYREDSNISNCLRITLVSSLQSITFKREYNELQPYKFKSIQILKLCKWFINEYNHYNYFPPIPEETVALCYKVWRINQCTKTV